MKVKKKLLRRLLDDYVMSAAEFARDMDVDVSEVEKMLNGEKVGERTARRFIAYVGPIEAERLIDFGIDGKSIGKSGGKSGGDGGL